MTMPRKVHEELLKMAAFEGEELKKILPEWERTAKRIGLTDEDVAYALDQYIPENWDIQYLGVRKMIGAYIREAIETANTVDYKKQGKKLVYGILPAVSTNYYAIKQAAGDDVYIGFPDLMLVTVLNSLFHKASPYFYKAEDEGFTYGCRHCPLNKMRVGAFANGVIAAPDIIWSWGFNCDEGPKTDEMIHNLISEDWNYIVSRVPHDTYFGQSDDDDEERVRYVSEVLKIGMDEIEKATGIGVTKKDMQDAVDSINRYMFKLGQLVSLASKADPLPLGGASLTQFQQPLGVPFNSGLRYVEEAADIMIVELRKAIKEGKGILPKGAPKLGSYFVPFCIPWVGRIFKENGVGMTFSETLTVSKKQLKPSKYNDDPYRATAEQWLKMPFGQNMGYEVESMVEKVNTLKPDGMLMGFFDFDRWLGAHQKMAAKLVEEKTGVPHFYMESDFWDDRDYSSESLRTRIESISQILKMKKGIE
jgi:benzoyl-CoA reductase/2-hydroxyglutaryl-CoA dehydratase subunit BcrC/BadD/HgdB